MPVGWRGCDSLLLELIIHPSVNIIPFCSLSSSTHILKSKHEKLEPMNLMNYRAVNSVRSRHSVGYKVQWTRLYRQWAGYAGASCGQLCGLLLMRRWCYRSVAYIATTQILPVTLLENRAVCGHSTISFTTES